MRITFDCQSVETLEYLKMVNTIMRSNQEVSANVEAYNSLKALVLSLNSRLDKIEAANRRANKVCR